MPDPTLLGERWGVIVAACFSKKILPVISPQAIEEMENNIPLKFPKLAKSWASFISDSYVTNKMPFYKTNLHFHTGDDPEKKVKYSFYEGIDKAAELGFEIIALTCQEKIIWSEEYRKYAEEKNILLVPGIEKIVQKKHVLILNPASEAEGIKSFEMLKKYRINRPENFIVAPHPYFPPGFSLKKGLEQNINLFDAIEMAWFYSKLIDFNKKASAIAASNNLPFIATSDTQILKFIDTSYALVEMEEKTIPALFEAIRKKDFKNITSPRKFWREMFWEVATKRMILGIN